MKEFLETGGIIIGFIMRNLFLWNIIFAIVIVFFERRDPKSVWAWLLLLYFIPILGFVFYLFFQTDMHKRKMFKIKEVEDHLSEAIRQQEHRLQSREPGELDEALSGYTDLILYNLEISQAVLSNDNDVDIFTEGRDKFKALCEDLRRAQHFIHLQYYIIRKDELFEELVEVLKERAAAGVEVRVLFDGMGSRGVKHRYWRQLESWGIRTAEFFPALLGRFHLRVNYRNHRKIVVIDNRVAYVGGFNIGREYLGLDKSFGHWRDTHLRIRGSAVLALQLRFLLDWNYAARQNLLAEQKYFMNAVPGVRDHCEMQIITSGPDNAVKQIRDNYLRLIHKAGERIYIQTPYFVPDEAVLDSLLVAIRSGIEVYLMIPCKPDHPFVYWATYSYMGDLLRAGAKCYTYNHGFLHSKGMIVDGKVLCYGTANMDIRSFSLNFEVNAIIYDEKKAGEMEAIFREDMKESSLITRNMYAGRGLWIRIKEQICRLMSPLL